MLHTCTLFCPFKTCLQAEFEERQASHDPNAIAALLGQRPYHVDALLAMHELYRSMGENEVRCTATRAVVHHKPEAVSCWLSCTASWQAEVRRVFHCSIQALKWAPRWYARQLHRWCSAALQSDISNYLADGRQLVVIVSFGDV